LRRLILELDVSEVAKYLDEVALEKLELMEVLSFLNEDPKEFSLVCRVRLRDNGTKLSEVIRDADARVLSRERDGSYIVFMRTRPHSPGGGSLSWNASGGFLATPYEIRDGKIKITFLGQPGEVRGFLRMVDKARLRYRVILLADARFSPSSPISSLTEKQREVLIMAYNLGYYDIPRRVGSDELATRLKIRNPTLVMHRRKAERAILRQLITEA